MSHRIFYRGTVVKYGKMAWNEYRDKCGYFLLQAKDKPYDIWKTVDVSIGKRSKNKGK
jgi:hypothetical protein